MKSKILMIIVCMMIAYGCHNGGDNLSLNTIDNHDNFRFEARYPAGKTDRLENYLNQEFNNELPLDQNVDLIVNLNGRDKFNLKASEGFLEINLDKRNSSLRGYRQLRKITEGVGKVLIKK